MSSKTKTYLQKCQNDAKELMAGQCCTTSCVMKLLERWTSRNSGTAGCKYNIETHNVKFKNMLEARREPRIPCVHHFVQLRTIITSNNPLRLFEVIIIQL